jgi:hypothetical protein
MHVVLHGCFRSRVSEPPLRHLDGYTLIVQNRRMPVAQQMPSHMGDSQLPYGGPDDPLEDLIREKRGCASGVEKKPVFILRTCSCFPKLLESGQIDFAQPDLVLRCVLGESISPLCTASRTQRQLYCQSIALQRSANNSLTRMPVAQANHTIVRYGSSNADWSCWSSLSLGSFGWNLTGS